VSPAPASAFAAVSAALTGFREVDLWGTGQVEPYLDEVMATVGDAVTARLLTTGWEAVHALDPVQAIQSEVMDDSELGPVARSVIILWYLGQWNPLPNEWRNAHGASPLDANRVISADAYRSGLVWKAIGAHPMGADPGGYGSWANPPSLPGA
jgi:hypothetical protein